MSSEGARRGYSRETIFVSLINENPSFKKSFQEALSNLNIIHGTIVKGIDVKKSCKSDVKIIFRDKQGLIHELGCSIKAAEANFNQLDRRWLSNWAEVLEMPEPIKILLQSNLDRKIIYSRDKLILPDQESIILPFLESKKDILFKALFTREDENLKAFIVYDENKDIWSVTSIAAIINNLSIEPFTISNQGVLYIGDCLSLQRKGGDGNITTPPKTSPSHPSNHLQFKIKPLSIIEKVTTINISPKE